MPISVPADLKAAIEADLGRGRQEELPLSNVDDRGRSYNPPRQDEARYYDPRIKQHLNSKWSNTIADAESEQMQGLTNLNARPWASMGPQKVTRFRIQQGKPPTVPQHAVPPPIAPTAQVIKVAPGRSVICTYSTESPPEQSPRHQHNELVEFAARTPEGKPPVRLDDVISSIKVLVRSAYCQVTGCSLPMLPAASSGEQQQQQQQYNDANMSAWLKRGTLDSHVDKTKLGLEKIMCFLGDLQLSMAAREPIMSSETMEVLKTIEVTPVTQPNKGLSGSIWANK